MTRAVFRLDPLPLNDVVVLDGAEGRHAATVRRIGVGESIRLTDGRGMYRDAEVLAVAKGALRLRCAVVVVEPVPDPRLVVVQALPKGERAELAVELLTELGADEIVPWAASRSVVQWRGDRAARALERWQRTAAEAGKQSRRARWPEVTAAATTAAVAERLSGAAAGLVLHEDATEPLAAVGLPASGEIVVVVGPEGGVSPEELAAFTDAGAIPVRLGIPVLRTSTAGGAALAALSVRIGRWS
ncbi:MAG: 16S rRNA (uracil(1498)-N(3))-methyltransferase [bacterium]